MYLPCLLQAVDGAVVESAQDGRHVEKVVVTEAGLRIGRRNSETHTPPSHNRETVVL